MEYPSKFTLRRSDIAFRWSVAEAALIEADLTNLPLVYRPKAGHTPYGQRSPCETRQVKDIHQRWRLGICEPLKAVLLGATLRVAAYSA